MFRTHRSSSDPSQGEEGNLMVDFPCSSAVLQGPEARSWGFGQQPPSYLRAWCWFRRRGSASSPWRRSWVSSPEMTRCSSSSCSSSTPCPPRFSQVNLQPAARLLVKSLVRRRLRGLELTWPRAGGPAGVDAASCWDHNTRTQSS